MPDLSGMSMRLPPQNLQAEQALLGAVLANNKAYDGVAGWLKPGHFADPVNGRIFEAVARRIDAGRLADALTLKGEFEAAGVLDEVGGVAYLGQLLGMMVSPTMAGEYGRAVRDAWHRRELIAIGEDLVNRCFVPGEASARDLHERAEEALAALADGQEGEAAPMPAAEAMGLAIDRAVASAAQPGGLVGITTGLRVLDDITGGLRGGQMVVVGARPSMGKTTLLQAMAAGAAGAGARVMLISMEMTAASLGAQLVAGLTPIHRELATRGKEPGHDDMGRFRWRAVSESEVRAMRAAQRAMAERRLLVVELRNRTMAAVRSLVRRQMRRGGLDLVLIDYLGLLRVPELARFDNRTLEVTRLSADIKALAVDFNLPVVVASQLNRGVEGRDVKRPGLADLRDSGSIEQDADIVMFLHRDHYYLSRQKLERSEREDAEAFANKMSRHAERMRLAEGIAELHVDKQREGRTGTVRVAFGDQTTWFSDLPEGVGA
jgi:replicative DNA helicase